MTNFCTAPTAREMESGECPGQTAAKLHPWGTPPYAPFMPGMPQQGEQSQVDSFSALSPRLIPLSPSERPGDLARARRSEPGASWLGRAQLWLVARPPLKKRLTRVLERCNPGGAPRAPCPSGFSFFRFSSVDREKGVLEQRGEGIPPQILSGGRELWGIGGTTGRHCLEKSLSVGCSGSPGAMVLGFGVLGKPQGQTWGSVGL